MKTGTAVLLGACLALAPAAWGQDSGNIVGLAHGRAIYLTHCAGCHGALGIDATGKPVRQPGTGLNGAGTPELALITARDGRFDLVHVASHIGARANAEGTSKAMPCWARHLVNDWPAGEAMAAVKVYWVARYLESAQEVTTVAKR